MKFMGTVKKISLGVYLAVVGVLMLCVPALVTIDLMLPDSKTAEEVYADNSVYDFRLRRLTVVNVPQNNVIFQLTGKMSFNVDRDNNQLEIIIEDGNGEHKSKSIGLSDSITYAVEDITDNEKNMLSNVSG